MRILLAAFLTLTAMTGAGADEMPGALGELRHDWAKVYYQTPQDRQVAQFPALAARADAIVAQRPAAAEPLILKAIILSTYAEAKGSLDALALVEEAERALWTPSGAGTLDYLRGRGLKDATIRAARLGWTPRAVRIGPSFTRERRSVDTDVPTRSRT